MKESASICAAMSAYWTDVQRIYMTHVRWIFLLYLVASAPYVDAFNIDVRHPVIHRGETGSYFGFAVEQHMDQDQPW